MISSTVARSYSGSSLIDSLLMRAIAWRRVARERLAQWRQRSAGRRELLYLTERDLRDIGVTRNEAQAEASKPFWQE